MEKWATIVPEAPPDLDGLEPFYPDRSKVFRAFELVAPSDVTVVLLGQDPYPTAGMATGLSFSVPSCTKSLPPSLRAIFLELSSEGYSQYRLRSNGDLTEWATENGVLLLNRALTVQPGKSGSDMKYWRTYTNTVIRNLSRQYSHIVWILLGRKAQSVKKLIESQDGHLILEAGHPSPLNRTVPFIGTGIFRAASNYLEKHKEDRPNRAWKDWGISQVDVLEVD